MYIRIGDMNDYLKELTKCIQNSKVRGGIMKEYKDYILDCKEALMEAGMTEEEAEEEAVRQMGDPKDAGKEMDRIYRNLIDWKMILWFLVCSVFVQSISAVWKVYEMIPYNILMSIGIIIAIFSLIWSAVEKYLNYNLFYAWARDWGQGGLVNSGLQLAVAIFFLAKDIPSAVKFTLILGIVQTIIRSAATYMRNKREKELLWQIGPADTIVNYKGKGTFNNKKISIRMKEKGEEIQAGTPIMIVGLEGAKPVVERV